MLVVGSWPNWDNHPHTPQKVGSRAPNEVGALLGHSCQCQQHCLPRGPFAAAAIFAVEPPLLVSLEPPHHTMVWWGRVGWVGVGWGAPMSYSATYSLLATYALLAAYSLLAT